MRASGVGATLHHRVTAWGLGGERDDGLLEARQEHGPGRAQVGDERRFVVLAGNQRRPPGQLVGPMQVAAGDGRRGLRELWSRMIRWRVGWQWYAAALLVPLGLALGTGGLNVAFGAPGSVIRDLSISEAVLLFALRLVVPLFAPIGEEPGWRGFALPRLLDGRSPLGATAILAPIVALWHAPRMAFSVCSTPSMRNALCL